MDLLPLPRRLRELSGYCKQPQKITRVAKSIGRPEPEAYSINIDSDGITLKSRTSSGLFYAEQTLKQIRQQCDSRLPCLEIRDWPDYPVRGFYHDVTRGKVPTLETLLGLAESCAHYKINQLQLYIEHTYAFKNHPEIWKDSDPLTAEEIRKLDARCAELNIDLVPSFTTFGHFYTWIHHKFPELNELERDVSGESFTWWDRQIHYTIDCQNPRSIELVREMIHEVRPLFRSRFFNICADETFDLGKGRNKALAEKVGNGRLYVDFLLKIMAAVKEVDAIPMFWGDIIGKHPQLMDEIPSEAILLDWDYSSKVESSIAPLLQQSGRTYFICPGCLGWNLWLPSYTAAHKNITRYAKIGRKHGATGLLNTDWGDYGHIQTLGPTLPGLILGAAASWNGSSASLKRSYFESSVSRMLLGDSSGELLSLLSRTTSIQKSNWMLICWIYQARSKNMPAEWLDTPTGMPDGITEYSSRVHLNALEKMQELHQRVEEILTDCKPQDPLIKEEIRIGMLGLEAMEELYLFFHQRAGKTRKCYIDPCSTAKRIRELDQRLSIVWMKRNKPSELFRVREILNAAAEDLERFN